MEKIKSIGLIALIICIVFVLIAGVFYFITIEDASWREGDNSNTPYAVQSYLANIDFDDEGNLSNNMTAQELWDKMLEDGCRVDEYLDGPEELQKLMNVQMVTDHLDTRENPDEEIDWEELNKNIDSTDMQGIVKLKRADNEGNVSTLTYVDPETFKTYVDNGNEKALSHFTIEKGTTVSRGSSSSTIYGTGEFKKYDLTEHQLKALATVCQGEQGSYALEAVAAEACLMANHLEMNTYTAGNYPDTGEGLYNYVKNSGWFAHASSYMDSYLIPRGGGEYYEQLDDNVVETVRMVLVEGFRTLPGYIDEHDCISDLAWVENEGESFEQYDRSGYKQNVTEMHNVYGADYTFYCFPSENSDPFGYLYEEKRQQIGDFHYEYGTWEPVNRLDTENANLENVLFIGDSIAEGLKTTLESQKAKVISKEGVNADYYLSEEFDWNSKIASLSKPNAICLILGQNLCGGGETRINKGIEDIGQLVLKLQQQFPDVPICINSVIPVIQNCTDYPNYMNDYNTVVESLKQYCSETSGITYVDTLNGYITNEGYAKNEMTAEDGLHPNATGNQTLLTNIKMKLCGYTNSSNGTGNSSGSTGTSSPTTITTFYAKVATWNEVTRKVESNDPTVESYTDGPNYRMTTTKINYQQFLSGYKMPFDYLWALLVISQDKEFVFELADLVYNSQIEITVHDNLTINTNVLTDTYSRIVEIVHNDGELEEIWKTYTTTTTVVTKTNTLDIALTKANVWIVDYEQIFTPETQADGTIKYVSSPATITEKTDKDAEEDNFVTILIEHRTAKSNINSAAEWLFEILENGPNTVEMVDLTKYLLYKATGIDYGVTEFDFEIFDPDNFEQITPGIYGGSIEEKVWFALLNAGYSKEAAAGAMGNFYGESGFRTNNLENSFESRLGYTDETYTEAVDSGSYSMEQFISDHTSANCGAGYGLAQWTFYTRKQGLYQYAKSKGVSISDENMQIEYMLGELSPSGGADGYATYQLSSYKGYSVSDWKNATTPENAAVAFCWIFEKPAGYDSVRSTKAREYYDKYKDLQQGGSFQEGGSSDSRIIGTFTSDITGRTFTIFNQNRIEARYEEGETASWAERCNRAAQISICSGYWTGGQPIDLIYKIPSDAPRSPGLYSECGLVCLGNQELEPGYNFDLNKLRTQIQSGGYAVIYVTGSNVGSDGRSKYGNKWAGSMHWVSVLGYKVTSSGEEQIFVSDSAWGQTGWHPIDEFEGITDCVVFINEQ